MTCPAHPVRVRPAEAPFVTRVHGLQHVEGLAASDLPHDDPVRSYPERVAHQVTHRISPRSSTFAGRAPSETTCGFASRSSAASSIVISRSSSEMNPDSTPSSVVLPLPAPPLITMLVRPRTQGRRGSGARAARCSRSGPGRRLDRNGREPADREHGTAERERRNDRVDLRAMGCRHAPQVVRGRTAVGSPPPLADTGVDGSIST
jgi:hypothetical protein